MMKIIVDEMHNFNRTYLKKRILVKYQGGPEFQPAGILKYVEDLKREPNAEIGPKDFFEMGSNPVRKKP